MILILLLFCCALPLPAQEIEAARRLLELPDVILLAEDPLYLVPPRPASWRLEPAGQPPADRLRLYGVNYPPILRANLLLPPMPAGVPAPSSTGWALGTAPPARSEAGPTAAEPAAPASERGELAAAIRYAPAEAVWTEVEFDRRLGEWTLESLGRLELHDVLLDREGWEPSFGRLALKAVRPAEAGAAEIAAEGSALLARDGSLLAAFGLNAGFSSTAESLRFISRTDVLGESRPDRGELAAFLGQELFLSWSGPALGFYGAAACSALGRLSDRSLEPQALARLGLVWAWKRTALRVQLGGAALLFQDFLKPYPEAQVELLPWPFLKLQAAAGPFLEPPLSFLFRAVNDRGELPVLGAQAGNRARAALQIEAFGRGSARVEFEASKGTRYRVRRGLLSWEEASELAAAVETSWTLIAPSVRRPAVTVSGGGSASFPLPFPAEPLRSLSASGVEGALRIVFPKPELELIMQSRWGDFPLDAPQSFVTERLSLSSGWTAAVQACWRRRNMTDWLFGIELSETEHLKLLFGCATRTGRPR